ncbi:hypothetical protein ACH5RR_020126 [Cinchona calisaya]|uniref:Uncharacterized protein n=1 Tax=Cinchona calisaya TaxID=153742 RepID=A0ABD2ZGK0_9GENT
MEKVNGQANADSTRVCKKLYNAVAANPAFRAIHRKSSRSYSPVAAITDTNQHGVQTTLTAAKTNVLDPLKKPVAQHKEDCNVEVHILMELGPPSNVPKQKEKMVKPTAKPTTVIVHIEGHDNDVALAPKGELKLPQPEKLKLNESDQGQLNKFASKKEKVDSPNIIAIQGHDQKINAPPKIDQPKVHNRGDQQEGHHSTANTIFSDYITRVKDKFGTSSNLGEETLNTSPFTRLATRRDTFK